MVGGYVGEQRHHGDRQRDPRRADTVEEAHHRPPERAEHGAVHARLPVGDRQTLDRRVERERAQQRDARPRDEREQRPAREPRPDPVPGGLRRSDPAPAAVGLGHERLHRESDPAQEEDHGGHQPVDRPHRRHRLGGYAADEPGVGEVERRLDRVGDHQRRSQMQHRSRVHAPAAVGPDPDRRQRRRRPVHVCGGAPTPSRRLKTDASQSATANMTALTPARLQATPASPKPATRG